MGRSHQQSALVTTRRRRPFQRRARAVGTQEAQPCQRAGFQRTAHAAAVAGRAGIRFARRCAVQVDDLLMHGHQ